MMELPSNIEHGVFSKESEVAEREKNILIRTRMIADLHGQLFRGPAFGSQTQKVYQQKEFRTWLTTARGQGR